MNTFGFGVVSFKNGFAVVVGSVVVDNGSVVVVVDGSSDVGGGSRPGIGSITIFPSNMNRIPAKMRILRSSNLKRKSDEMTADPAFLQQLKKLNNFRDRTLCNIG